MNMEIDGLIAEARMHFQRALQLFLSTFTCSIFILPSVSICTSQDRLEAIYTKAVCKSRVARYEKPGQQSPKELHEDELYDAGPTFGYLLPWELNLHCVKYQILELFVLIVVPLFPTQMLVKKVQRMICVVWLCHCNIQNHQSEMTFPRSYMTVAKPRISKFLDFIQALHPHTQYLIPSNNHCPSFLALKQPGKCLQA